MLRLNVVVTDQKAACMVVSDEGFVMLLTEPGWMLRRFSSGEQFVDS